MKDYEQWKYYPHEFISFVVISYIIHSLLSRIVKWYSLLNILFPRTLVDIFKEL